MRFNIISMCIWLSRALYTRWLPLMVLQTVMTWDSFSIFFFTAHFCFIILFFLFLFCYCKCDFVMVFVDTVCIYVEQLPHYRSRRDVHSHDSATKKKKKMKIMKNIIHILGILWLWLWLYITTTHYCFYNIANTTLRFFFFSFSFAPFSFILCVTCCIFDVVFIFIYFSYDTLFFFLS